MGPSLAASDLQKTARYLEKELSVPRSDVPEHPQDSVAAKLVAQASSDKPGRGPEIAASSSARETFDAGVGQVAELAAKLRRRSKQTVVCGVVAVGSARSADMVQRQGCVSQVNVPCDLLSFVRS